MRISSGLILILVCGQVLAETRLPAFFSNGMVLQQNTEVAVWGWDEPGERVRVSASWGEETRTRTAEDGSWRVLLPTPGAGGPHELKIRGNTSI